jgi:hypothetical protein
MTVFDQPDSRNRLQMELKLAVKFCFWVVLLGPLAQVLVWASVEGFSVPWGKAVHLYVLVLVHFLCYTPLFGGALVLIRSRGLRPNWLVVCIGGAALVGLSSLCAVWISIALGVKPASDWHKALLVSACTGVGVTVVVLAIERLYKSAITSRLDAQSRELDRERAQRATAEARWNSLESRVHPHFLFNTLSSIRELMHRDIAEADAMIQRFAGLIRFSLDSSCNTLVPLAEELQTVSQYLEIEKMRLGPRLTYRLTMTPQCSTFTIPALSVLTLVENSVKHAVACRRSGGRIEINTQVEGVYLRVDVRDDGAGFDESAILPGHGLDLLLRRLESLYQSNTASLLLAAAGVDVTLSQVTLLIPIKMPSRDAAGTTGLTVPHEQTSLLPS